MPTRLIAEITQVPPSYLVKVLQLLVSAGIVKSQRGLNGGVVLSREPEEFSVLDVIQATDPLKKINSCPLGITGHDDNLCSMHRCIDEAVTGVSGELSGIRLNELVAWPCTAPGCPDQFQD